MQKIPYTGIHLEEDSRVDIEEQGRVAQQGYRSGEWGRTHPTTCQGYRTPDAPHAQYLSKHNGPRARLCFCVPS